MALTLQDSTHLRLAGSQICRNLSLRDASRFADVPRALGAGFEVRS